MGLSADVRQTLLEQIRTIIANQVNLPDRPVVFNILRPGFQHDIVELRRRAKHFNWCGVPIEEWASVHRLMMPAKLNNQLSAFIFADSEHEPFWRAAEDFAMELLTTINEHFTLAAVMSANFDYGVDEGLRRACRKLPFPFVALNRELAVLKCHFDSNQSYYRDYRWRPAIDGVAVGSELARRELVDFGVLRDEQVQITGFPRLDPWIDRLQSPSSGEFRSIVLLSYAHPDYLSGENFAETLNLFADVSTSHGAQDFNFIVKCKDVQDSQAIAELLKGRVHRLNLTYHSTYQALGNARCAIGLNSLSLVEALLSRAKILVPQWGGARGPEDQQAFWRENPEHRRHITFVESANHFTALLRQVMMDNHADIDVDGRVKLVQGFVEFRTDGTAAAAVENFVQHFVDRRRGRH